MPFAAAISTEPQTTRALHEVCAQVAGPAVASPDLALVFFSPHHAGAAENIAATLQERLAPRALLGCVGEAVIGNDQEVEEQPAVSLWLGKWASVEIEPFQLVLERTSEGLSLLGWPDALVGADPTSSVILLLGDPYTFPADFCLNQVNEDSPRLRVLGGMASGVTGRGET